MCAAAARARHCVLRAAEIHVEAPQAVGHGPLEHAPVSATLRAESGIAYQLDDADFLAAFDDDQETRDASRVCNSPAGETSAATELIGRRTLAKPSVAGL